MTTTPRNSDRQQDALGRSWLQHLREIGAERLSDTNALLAAQRQLEAIAAKTLEELTNEIIPAGIRSCVARGSASLTVEVMPDFLASTSYRSLQDWLTLHALTGSIVALEDGHSGISLTPRL